MKKWTPLILSLGVTVFVTPIAFGAIFGADDREEASSSGSMGDLTRSVAVGVLSTLQELKDVSGSVELSPSSTDFLCPDQKYSNQLSLPYACTGFLVAPQILVTAGHCTFRIGEFRDDSGDNCKVFSWMFDYRNETLPKDRPLRVTSSNVYGCKRIVYAVQDEKSPGRDFALIELDRPVLDRTPMALATTDSVLGETVSMIGHPLGMPAKVSVNARVVENKNESPVLFATLDAFEGNSGSPVFNKGQQVIGILVAGTPSESLIDRKGASCSIYNRCDENGMNCLKPDVLNGTIAPARSEVQKIDAVLKALSSEK